MADVSAVCTMNNQRPNPPRKKIKPTDLILFAVAIFLLFMTPWGNTNSYHRLMLFLYFLCVLLRFSNIRKQKMREFEHKRKMEERAAMQQATEALPADTAEAAPTEALPAQSSENTSDEVQTEPKNE
ncbi:hypothetical protein [Anaerotignum sp.]|uniref:hypothetical protein n=1 Tax=Anaerotignum sp. TaxID=2039241 RepID=UPI0027BB1027|nr:hypothetical protein [Anaerotignum sp.]